MSSSRQSGPPGTRPGAPAQRPNAAPVPLDEEETPGDITPPLPIARPRLASARKSAPPSTRAAHLPLPSPQAPVPQAPARPAPTPRKSGPPTGAPSFRRRAIAATKTPFFTPTVVLVLLLVAVTSVWLKLKMLPPEEKPIVIAPEAPVRKVSAPKGFVRTVLEPLPPPLVPPSLPPAEKEARLAELAKDPSSTPPPPPPLMPGETSDSDL